MGFGCISSWSLRFFDFGAFLKAPPLIIKTEKKIGSSGISFLSYRRPYRERSGRSLSQVVYIIIEISLCPKRFSTSRYMQKFNIRFLSSINTPEAFCGEQIDLQVLPSISY